MKRDDYIFGSGGGGKGGGSAAQQSPTTLRSSEKAILLDALCEGPISGLVNGAQSIYLNKVPLQNADGSWNFNQAVVGWTTGTLGSNTSVSSTLIGGAGSVSSTTTVGAKVYQATPLVRAVTTANVDTLQVTLNTPTLDSTDPSNGNTNGASVEFTIGVQSNGGGYVIRVHDTFNGTTYSNYARTYTIPVSGAGPFDIQVTRITEDSGSSLLNNDLYWQDFSAIISTNLEYRNTAMAYIAIDAQQFGSIPSRAYLTKGLIVQIPSNYNPTTRAYTGTWDGTFVLGWTDNPAWCFYDILTNDRYGLGDLIPAATVNKWQLYQIAQYCDGMVPDGYGGTEPRFTCNLLLASKKEAYTVLQNMASIFRGMVYWGAGSITPTQDAPATPVMSFTPANVIGGAFSYQGTSLKARHTAVMVAWNDPNEFYATVMEYVQSDALVAKFGVVQANIVAMGCTSRGQAHRIGQWLLYTENLETEAITFKCAMDGAFLYPGAIVQTSDPMRAGVRMGGRVLAIDSTKTVFTLDAAPPATTGLTLQCALPDGTMGSATVAAVNGAQVTIGAAFPTTPVIGAVYLLSESTVQPEQWRVVTLAESGPNELQITATTYNSSKYAYIEDGAPLVPPQISTLSATPVVPTNLALGVSRYNADTGPAGVIGTLSWTGSASTYIVTMQQAGGNLTSQTVKGTSVVFNNLNLSVVYTFTVTAVSALGIQSQPASLVTTPTAAQIGLEPLPTATAMSATGGVFMITLNWSFTTTRTDIAWAEIWGATTDNLANAVRLTTVPWPTATWQHNGLTPGSAWFYWVRVVDMAGDDGPYFPASTTAGIQGSPSTDPSSILTQLTNAIGTNQLAASLATPIAAIPGIQSQQATNVSNIAANVTAINNEIAARGTAVTNEATTRANADSNLAQSITTVQASSQGANPNLIANAGFVPGGGTWNTANCIAANTLPAVLQPAPALNVLYSAAAQNTDSNQFAVVPGDVLDMELWIGLPSAITDQVGIAGATAAAPGAAESGFVIQSVSGSFSGWQKVTATYTVPAGVGALRLFLWVNETTAGESCYFAAPSVTKRSAALAGAYSGIQTEATARAAADTSLADQITTLTATVNSNESSQTAAVQNEATTRANADSANATATQTVQSNLNATNATVGTLQSGLASTNSTLATVQSQQSTNTSAIAANAQSITTVQASIVSRPNLCPDVDQWTLFAGCTVTTTNGWGKEALCSVPMANGTYVATSPSMACVGGATYVVTGDSVLFATTADAYFDLQFYDSSGTNVLDGPQNSLAAPHDFSTTNSNRNANAVQVTAPSNAVSMQARFVVNATNAVTAAGFRLVKVERGTLPATPYTTEQALASVTQTSTANASAITGLSAKYTLQVDANGHVAGMELASGAGQSQIVLLADALAFYNNSTAVPLLEAGTVNGVSSVGVNGQLIIDGSVTATQINGYGLNISGNGNFVGTIKSSAFMTGAFTGYAWPANGAGGGAYMDGNGAMFGNANQPGMGYFLIQANGNVWAPGFSIVNGTMSLPNAVIGTAQIQNLSVGGQQITGVVSGVVGMSNFTNATVYTVGGRLPLVSVYKVILSSNGTLINPMPAMNITYGNGYFTLYNQDGSLNGYQIYYTYL